MTRDEQLIIILAACVMANPQKIATLDRRGDAGRSIRLTDVIMAMETGRWYRDPRTRGREISDDTSKVIALWSLEEDELAQQSDECIGFLADLLAKK
jgi:hypothetical protein